MGCNGSIIGRHRPKISALRLPGVVWVAWVLRQRSAQATSIAAPSLLGQRQPLHKVFDACHLALPFWCRVRIQKQHEGRNNFIVNPVSGLSSLLTWPQPAPGIVRASNPFANWMPVGRVSCGGLHNALLHNLASQTQGLLINGCPQQGHPQ